MAEIRWTDEAQRWLGDIYEYIAADNAQAAAQTVQGIYDDSDTYSAPLRAPISARHCERYVARAWR